MAKVYVSSTYNDLIDHRAAACLQLRKHGHQVISMEDYNPGTRQPLAKCLADVADADIYVGIIGWRYGHIPADDNPDGQSITEREYRHALVNNAEIVILMADEAVSWPPPLVDSHTGDGEAAERVNKLRMTLGCDHTCAFFDTPTDLAAKLSPAIEEAYRKVTPPKQEQLNDVQSLIRSDLIQLATLFEVDRAFDLSDSALRQLLEGKATEFRAMKAEIATLRRQNTRLDKLAGTALAALNEFSFDHAEQLIAGAREIARDNLCATLKQNADLLRLEARSALMRGRVAQAFAHLSTAADSFLVVDRAEPARRRMVYAEQLEQHGLRYGGDGMSLSESMLRDAIGSLNPKSHPSLWIRIHMSLAVTLTHRGARLAGGPGWTMLDEAVSILRAALAMTSRSEKPLAWANIQYHLSGALTELGRRSCEPNRTIYVSAAVKAAKASLKEIPRKKRPMEWAQSQLSLGEAFRYQAYISDGQTGSTLHSAATRAFRSALRVWNREEHPENWASTQNSLAGALLVCGSRAKGKAGARLLGESITAYQAVLAVFVRAEHPIDWALAQVNLAIASEAIAENAATDAPKSHLQKAMHHVNSALTVYNHEGLSQDRAKATILRAEILKKLALTAG